jgi:class 3 adenylate cyclase
MPSARCGRRSQSSALAELNRRNEGASRPELAARIAIDTGPAVLDAGGEIFGDVPNIAARAQALAEPGTVVVTGRVQRQVVGLFVVEEMRQPRTQGRARTGDAIPARAGKRWRAPRWAASSDPTCGSQIAMLMRRWERAAGRGPVGADRRRARLG